MYHVDKQRAYQVLLESGFTNLSIESFLENFPTLDDSLREPVEKWLENQQVPELVVEGVPIQDIIEKRRSHFLKAIQDLNRLLDPNLTPEQHENWKRIITTPRFYE